MRYKSRNVESIKGLVREMILNQLYEMVENIHSTEFGGLHIRSKIARSVLKKENVFDASDIEIDLFLRNLNFEVAKLIGKLEFQTGATPTVKRTSTNAVDRNAFFGNVPQHLIDGEKSILDKF